MKNEATNTAETATVAEQAAPVALEQAPSGRTTTRKKVAPKGGKAANGAKPKKAAKKPAVGKKTAKPARAARAKATSPRAESKGAKILEMIGRGKGASLAEIMKATGWQAHSVRGFLSTAGKKRGVRIRSTKNEAGDRLYKIAK